MNHLDIDTPSFRKMKDEESIVLIDVRSIVEFNSGFLKGAVNIDLNNPGFEESIDELDKRVKYLVYCRSGNRSRQAMFLMRDLGFEEVYNLSEGIISWNDFNFPVEKS